MYRSHEFVNRLKLVGWTGEDFMKEVEFDFISDDMIALRAMLEFVHASGKQFLTPNMVKSLKDVSLRLATEVLVGRAGQKSWKVKYNYIGYCSLLVYMVDAIVMIDQMGPGFEKHRAMFDSLRIRLDKFLTGIVENAEADDEIGSLEASEQ